MLKHSLIYEESCETWWDVGHIALLLQCKNDKAHLLKNRSGITDIVSHLFSQTRNANMSGQQQLAERNSKMAFTLNNTALGVGIVILMLYVTLIIVNTKNQSHP